MLRAARAIAGMLFRTPVITSDWFDARHSAQLFFKCENLQRTGSFKSRGALTALRGLTPAQRRRGVVGYSSGNHAQALAWAGSVLDVPVTVLMPADAPEVKVDGAHRHGARVMRYDRYADDREQLARDLAASTGLTLIPSADAADVVAGQGTATAELIDDSGPLDLLLVPVGGGGLMAGAVLAAQSLSPGCAVIGVEPALGNDAELSMRQNRLVSIDTPQTIADGAQVRQLGRLPFEIIRSNGGRVVTVGDDDLTDTMALVARHLHIVAEPTACLPIAAILTGAVPVRGRRVGVLVSGGNVDLDRFTRLLAARRDVPSGQPDRVASSSRTSCSVRG